MSETLVILIGILILYLAITGKSDYFVNAFYGAFGV